MIHIKTYEKEDTIPKIKIGDYVIWLEDGEEYYEIIVVTKIETIVGIKKYWSRVLYVYDEPELEFRDLQTQQFFTDKDIIEGSIHYISKNLDDCIEMLYLIFNSKKYNI